MARAGSYVGAQMVHWTPRLARASVDAATAAAWEMASWGPPLTSASQEAARFTWAQVRRFRPEVSRVDGAPAGQDFRVGGVKIRRSVETFRAQRFRYVVPQQLDYSCGAAALATLFQHYYGDPVSEAEIIRTMLSGGDTDRIEREGFSLLDMKNFSKARGYRAGGFRIGLGTIDDLKIPAIALVNTRGYSHFVVLKGSREEYVYLADPALGQRKLPIEEFAEEWTGVVLFVAKNRPDGVVAPLEVLALHRPSPVQIVRDLDLLGIRSVVFDNTRVF